MTSHTPDASVALTKFVSSAVKETVKQILLVGSKTVVVSGQNPHLHESSPVCLVVSAHAADELGANCWLFEKNGVQIGAIG